LPGILCGVDFVDFCRLQSTRLKYCKPQNFAKWLFTAVNSQTGQQPTMVQSTPTIEFVSKLVLANLSLEIGQSD
jgi:hypothetical protein